MFLILKILRKESKYLKEKHSIVGEKLASFGLENPYFGTELKIYLFNKW